MRGRNFLICGLTGWCMEILFTSAGSLARHDGRLIGQTSLWMFPIYGMAACIGPVYAKIKKLPGTSARQHLYSGYFFIRVLKRVSLKAASLLPLGLQQRQGKCQWVDPAGLCPVLAWRGSAL